MIPARSDQPPFEFLDGDRELERLTQMEHKRWMKAKPAVGWCYGPDTSKDQLTHEALLP